MQEDTPRIQSVENHKVSVLKHIEKQYHGHIISFSEVCRRQPKFGEMLKSLSRFGNIEKRIVCIYGNFEGNFDENRVKVYLFTPCNEYSISARLPNDKDEGYIGCIVSSRLYRAGEHWVRGNDLTDGKYNLETWHEILCDIISYELVAQEALDF